MNKQNIRPIRRVLAVILSLALLLTFTPLSGVVTLTAGALDDAVTYIGADGTLQTITDYTLVESYDGPRNKTWEAGNYVVWNNVTINVTGKAAVKFLGTVNLILCDDAQLTVNSTNSSAFTGIDKELNIFAQSTGSNKGKLTAKGDTGVDCGSLNVYGGEVTFEGTRYGLHLDGYNDSDGLTVNGGDVRIVNKTDDQAAIYDESSVGHMTVDGGTLTVSSSDGGKAIEYTNSIAFNDGTANITGNITDFSTLALNGGNVTIEGGLGGFDGDASDNEVILDYQRPTDKYKITNLNKLSDKNDYTVKVAENKTVSADGTSYTGTLTAAQRAAISGKDITPFFGTVTVADGIANGTVSADKTLALTGDTVTLTVTPKTGYVVESVTAGSVQVTTVDDTHYTFTMPASDVTVSATFTPDSAYFSQDGDTYTIHGDTGWDIFCDCLQDNDTYNRFSGKTVELEKDITVSRMAGSSHHDFCGTFEGGGKTLTFTPTESVNGTAPFSYVSETTPTGGTGLSHPVICNLNVVCDITTSATHASGLVGRTWGELTIANCTVSGTITSSDKYACGFIGEQNGTANITNCRSSVEINSSVNGDGTHGGFIGRTMNNTSTCIEGCVFDGKIVSIGDDATTSCGGFVGWRDKNGSLTITNSLYTPTADDNAVADGATFARNWTMPDNANCYYTRTLGTAQGKQAYTITHGEDVTLGLSGKATEYDVSGITAYAGNSGLKYGETTLCAGSGDTVTLTVAPSAVGYAVNSVSVNDGAVAVTSNENGTYSFTMPDSNAAVTAELEEASYFDASTGTLTLKGNVLNSVAGIVLPDGVKNDAVKHINVDSSGATLPQDSSWLFQNVTNVRTIDLTGADTSNVTNMAGMFYNCSSLETLDLSSFDTSNVTNMENMFFCCYSLKKLDLSSFDTSFVNCMTKMFTGCEHLTELNLSSFDTSNVTEMNSMFLGCFELKTIYVSEQWSTESVIDSTDMFEYCRSLKGGNDTAYDGSKIDREYACIDKDGQPGYLTGTYAVTVPAGITISPVNAIIDSVPFCVKGETITISPKEGYIIADAFVYIDLGYDIIDIEITDNNDGTFSFTMPESEVSVDVETAFTDGIGAALAGHSISLEGDIGVNFYMDLDPEIAQSETAYMQFTIPNGSKSETKTVFVKDAREDGGYYIFKCSVAAKDMSSEITAQLIDGDNTSTVYTYSVREYADYLIEHRKESQTFKDAAPLVEKMLRYGDYAKEYFDETDTLPDLGDVNIDSQFATYTSTVSDDLFDGATLSLKSQTTLSLYFTDEDELTFTCVDENGAERTVETVRNGSTQIARIRNIAAKELQDDFTLTVKKGETVLGAITYSPMNYCCKALNGGTEDENLINVVKALVAYSDAANEYFTEGV